MPHAMQIRRSGGLGVLKWIAVDVGEDACTEEAVAPVVRGLKVGDP